MVSPPHENYFPNTFVFYIPKMEFTKKNTNFLINAFIVAIFFGPHLIVNSILDHVCI